MLRETAIALVLVVTAGLSSAAAQDERPSSGDMSILSGRTLGNGQTVVAGAIGWPSVWGMVMLAPSSKLNLGVRGAVTYGALMGFDPGVGGTLSVPIRLHIFSGTHTDFAIYMEPGATVGEGALMGQTGTFANNFGLSLVLNGGFVFGLRISSAVTFALGAAAEFAYVDVPDVPDGNQIVATTHGILGVEVLMSRDTMLLGEFRLGYGFAPEVVFDSRVVARLSLGLAYLM